ncbi:polycystin family receptor for egg jelly-like isoform X2 [Argopecten irradians]|uniref:polycystin family receptor for egg jelly-like isoform X2 n=1 Tax=Argopecten irradians TaxID=31199 RepID=UPI00371874ED
MEGTYTCSLLLLIYLVQYTVALKYYGCFEVDKRNRVFTVTPGDLSPEELTPANCATKCGVWLYNYCGLEYGKFCRCGKNPPPESKRSNSSCVTPCMGDTSVTCGARDYVEVYTTSPPIVGLALNASSGMTGSEPIMTFTPVTFAVHTDSAGLDTAFRMNYGDGAGRTDKNDPDMYTHQFVLPGSKQVTVIANDYNETMVEKVVAITVNVVAAISGVNLTCPTIMGSYERSACTLELQQGSYISLTIKKDVDEPETLSLADADIRTIGMAIPAVGPANPGSSTVNDIVAQASEFQHPGKLYALEFYAETTGTITVKVLRPSCNDYCFATNMCGGTCPGVNNIVCTPGELYCVSGHACWTSGPCESPSRYDGNQRTDLTMLDSITHTITAPGYHYLPLSTDIDVTPGCVLGFQGVTLGARSADDPNENDVITSDFTDKNLASSASRRHLLRGYTTQGTKLEYSIMFKTAGMKNMVFTLQNEGMTSIAPTVLTRTINCVEGVNASIISIPSYVPALESVLLEVLPHTGTSLTYYWVIESGGVSTYVNTTNDNTETFTFVRGRYTVSVTIENPSSMKSNSTTIIAEEPIEHLALTQTSCIVDEVCCIKLSMSKGSDYTCSWTIDGVFEQAAESKWLNHQAETKYDETPPNSCFNYTFEFENVGNPYRVSVRCTNGLGTETSEILINARERIKDVVFEQTGALVGESFFLAFTFGSGATDLFYSLSFNNTLPALIQDSFVNRVRTVTTYPAEVDTSKTYPVVLWMNNTVSQLTLSFDFGIEEPIVNPVVTPDFTVDANGVVVKEQGTSVGFTVSMTSGTNPKVHIDFGDSTANATMPTMSTWSGTPYTTSHTYTVLGAFTITVTVYNTYNSFNYNYRVFVVKRVENLAVSVHATQILFTPPVFANFTFSQTVTEDAPNMASVTIDDGSGFPSVDYPFAVGTPIPFLLYRDGDFTVTFNVSNPINSMILTQSIQVIEIIGTIDILPQGSGHAPIGEVVNIDVMLSRGDTGSDLRLTFDPGNGQTPITRDRTGVSPNGVDTFTATYSTVGNYTITVTAVSLLETKSQTYIIVCQSKITENYVFVTDHPQEFPSASSASITLQFQYNDDAPTDATYILDNGDGTSFGPATLASLVPNKGIPGDITTTYTVDGDFYSTITITNLVSSTSKTINSGVYRPFQGLAVQTRYQPKIGNEVSGIGPLNQQFPAGEVIFYMTSTQGTFVYYDVRATSSNDIHVCNITTKDRFKLNFTAGVYTVDITARNYIENHKETVSTTVIVQDPVAIASVTHDSQTVPVGTAKQIDINFNTVGDLTCVYIDLGDGNITLLGNSAMCSTKFNSSVMSENYQSSPSLSLVTTITHAYYESNLFNVSVYAYNDVSESWGHAIHAITEAQCVLPTLSIRFPMLSSDFQSSVRVRRSEIISLQGEASINCSETLQNQKEWWIEAINDYGTSESYTDVTSLSSYQTSELVVWKNFLALGTYKVTYKMAIQPETSLFPFETSVHTYIKVEASPIVAKLFPGGMSKIQWKHGEPLTIDPGALSVDPDVPAGQSSQFAGCRWWCRKKPGSFDDGHLSLPLDSAVIATTTDYGGCFRQGNGRIDTDALQLQFNTDNMHIGEVYEFKIVIYTSDGREAEALGELEIVDFMPPLIIPECCAASDCTQLANGVEVSATTKLSLCAVCYENFDLISSYRWTVSRPQYQWEWEPLQFSQLKQYINDDSSEQISFEDGIFEAYGLSSNMIRITLDTTLTSGKISSTSLDVKVNMPPANGSCTVTPTTGQVTLTWFTFTCMDWEDTDGIARYAFYVTFSQRDGERMLGYQLNPSYVTQLPMGPDYDSYQVHTYVRITDTKGASKEYFIATVTVNPLSAADLETKLATLNAGNNDALDNIYARQDVNEVSAAVSELSSLLFQYNFGENYAAGYNKPAINDPAYDNPQNLGPDAPVNETIMAEAERKRNEGTKMVNDGLAALSGLPLRSIDSVLLVTSVGANFINSPEFLSREAQNNMASLAEKAIDTSLNLISQDVAIPIEERKDMASSIIGMLYAARSASTINYQNPSQLDIDNVVDIADYDTDTFSEKEPMPVGLENPAEGLQTLLLFTSQDQQSGVAAQLEGTTTSTVKKVDTFVISGLNPGDNPITFDGSTYSIRYEKNSISKLSGAKMAIGGAEIIPPDLNKVLSLPSETPLSIKASTSTFKVPGLIQGSAPGNNEIGTVSITLYDENNKEITVSNIKERFEITIPRDPKAYTPPPDPVEPFIQPGNDFSFFFIVVDKNRAAVQALFNFTESEQLLVVVRSGGFPNITTGHIDHVCLVPNQFGQTDEASMTCTITTDMLRGFQGRLYFGVRQLLPSERNKYRFKADLPKSYTVSGNFTFNYTLSVSQVNCLYVNTTTNTWEANGCSATEKSSSRGINCLCSHLTTFTGDWAVAPNTIDWNFVFSNMDFFKNPTLYITEMVIAAVYIVAVIWARRQDKKDVEKLGLTPLIDNDVDDKYYYEIIVSTGMRRNAGTNSKVNFILSGDLDETEVRCLSDDKRKVFQRGNVDGFLMAVKRPLGPLNYLHIWHDNSGKGNTASWYMNTMVVRDVQTDEKYIFINNKWFAVEEGDGMIDRIIAVAGKEQMTEFGHLFTEKTTKNLNDGHLWFSVVARPPQSRFTRVQRVSCCLCLLYVTMLSNAMFYENGAESAGSSLAFGPFSLSPTQVYIGVICNLIVFPVNFLIVFLFRRSRPRSKRPSRVEEAIKSSSQMTASMTDVNPRLKSAANTSRVNSSMLIESGKRPDTSMSRAYTSLSVADVPKDGMKKKKKMEFPWFFTIFAWILLWLATLVSAAFVTFYGVMFQDLKCKQWITSMLISFFTSVFITQPIKVFAVAILFSLIIKNPGGDEEEEADDEEKPKNLSNDEEYLHDEFGMGATKPKKASYVPADNQLLDKAREVRLKEIKMWAVIREIIFYSFFVWILMVISYQNRNTNSYLYKFSMEQVFIITNDTNHKFEKITNTQNFWQWAKSGLATGIRANKYYNDDHPLFLRGYINDKVSRLMGYATMRQLRSKKDTCRIADEIAKVIPECNGEYTIVNQDEDEYQVGWRKMYGNSSDNTREEYRYTSASELNGYPYWGQMALYAGGGYLVRLRGSSHSITRKMKQLESEGWIDKYTRAVFVEFTVYNPGVNLFAISTLLAEFRPSNGIFPSYRFEPATLLPYMNDVMLFQLACEVIYLLFTVYFIVREVRGIIREKIKYFKQFWNLIEFGICGMSVTAVVLYFYRLVITNTLTERFKHTHGNEYMKFQYVGYWSEIFSYIIGWLVFLGTLKFLKLLRFNKKMSLLASTLKNSCKDLMHFSIIFNIVFLAFIQFFYLIYVAHIKSFSTFITALESGIVMMMGKFEIYSMLRVNPVITQVSLFLYVVAITFIVVNMFLSILNETFSAVRNDIDKQNNDYEIVQFMLERFKLWTGFGTVDKSVLKPEDVRKAKQESMAGKIDEFPDRIDKLLNSISNVYMEKDRIDSIFEMNARGGKSLGLSKGAMAKGSYADKASKGLTTVHTD